VSRHGRGMRRCERCRQYQSAESFPSPGARFCARCLADSQSAARSSTLPSPAERARGAYPGAAWATWDAMPPACDRCGGLWRPMPGGVACRGCGRHGYVAEALARRGEGRGSGELRAH